MNNYTDEKLDSMTDEEKEKLEKALYCSLLNIDENSSNPKEKMLVEGFCLYTILCDGLWHGRDEMKSDLKILNPKLVDEFNTIKDHLIGAGIIESYLDKIMKQKSRK